MLSVIFRSAWRQRDDRLVEVNLAPGQIGDLAEPLSGQDQESNEIAIVALFWQRIPDFRQFGIGQNATTRNFLMLVGLRRDIDIEIALADAPIEKGRQA